MSIASMSAQRPAEDPERRDSDRVLREEFARFRRALDAGDIPEARRSWDAWAAHLPKLDDQALKALIATPNR